MNFRKNINDSQLGFQIAPLIDIVFLILIWFISATMYARFETKIGIKVPTAKTGEHLRRFPGELVINLDKDGKVFVNSVETSRSWLREKLVTLATTFPDQPVIIRADEATAYKQAIEILDLCRAADITAISFSVSAPDSTDSPRDNHAQP